MKTARLAWLVLPLAATAFPAAAQDLTHARSLAATCTGCHGTDGRTTQGSAVPALAGMPQGAMLVQLRAFRDGSRPSTVMGQIAKGYTEAQLEQIAGYFAGVKK